MQPIVIILLVPCECIHSSVQTYHISPLLVAPGPRATGAYRPAVLVHLIPLHAPEEQSPPFVIGKHAEELVCASRGRGRNKEETNISTFLFSHKQTHLSQAVPLVLIPLPEFVKGQSRVFYCISL